MSALRDWAALFIDMGQGAVYLVSMVGDSGDGKIKEHTTMVTAADTVTPDASLTSPLLTIDQHRGYRVENMRRVATTMKSIVR